MMIAMLTKMMLRRRRRRMMRRRSRMPDKTRIPTAIVISNHVMQFVQLDRHWIIIMIIIDIIMIVIGIIVMTTSIT